MNTLNDNGLPFVVFASMPYIVFSELAGIKSNSYVPQVEKHTLSPCLYLVFRQCSSSACTIEWCEENGIEYEG